MPRPKDDYNFSNIKNSYFAYRRPKHVTHAQYTSFIKALNKLLVEWVLDGNILKLPFTLGKIFIEKYKPSARTEIVDGKLLARSGYTDHGATRRLRLELEPTWTTEDWLKLPTHKRPFVVYTNEHTQGFSYKITWLRQGTSTHVKYYQFLPNRIMFKQGLFKRLTSDNIIKPNYYDKLQIRNRRNDTGKS